MISLFQMAFATKTIIQEMTARLGREPKEEDFRDKGLMEEVVAAVERQIPLTRPVVEANPADSILSAVTEGEKKA